jgi:hypothetical protein
MENHYHISEPHKSEEYISMKQLTKTLASGVATLGVVAGVGLASLPAYAVIGTGNEKVDVIGPDPTTGFFTSPSIGHIDGEDRGILNANFMFGAYADFFSDINPPTFLGDLTDADAVANVMANVLNNSGQFVPAQPDGSFVTTVLDPMTEVTSGEFFVPFDFNEVANTVNSVLVSFDDTLGLWSVAGETGDLNAAEDRMFAKFEEKSVPEPTTVLGLVALGGLGLVSKSKKRK